MNNSLPKKLIMSMFALAILATASPAPKAHAATTADLQAQIAALISQINSMQTQSANNKPNISLLRNLALGMSGSDVLALQQFLNSDPDTVITLHGAGSKGNESTYFGALTQQAVIKFQNKYRSQILVPAGLTQGTGFVGASTRAQIQKLGALTMPANPTGGQSTSGNTSNNTEEIVAEEGDIRVTRGSEHIRTLGLGETEDIYSIDIKAEDSTMTINRIDFLFDKKVWRYIDSFELYQDGKKIASLKATESNFSTEGSEYRLRFGDLKATVSEDHKDTFVLTAKGIKNLSTSRESDTLSVYVPKQGIRAVDTAKLTTYGPNSDLVTRTFDFRETEEDGVIVVRLSDKSPDSGSIAVENNSNSESTVLIATLKADESDITFKNMYVKVASSETNVSNVVRKLSLSHKGNVIASESVVKNGTSAIIGRDEDGNAYTIIDANEYYVRFDDLEDITINDGDKEDIKIVAEFNKADGIKYASGTTVTFTIRAIDGDNIHGEDITSGNLNIGNDRVLILYTEGLSFAFVSEKTSTKGVSDRRGVFQITFEIQAFGDDIYVPIGASRQTGTTSVNVGGIEYSFVNSDGARYTLGSVSQSTEIKSAKQIGSFYKIDEGTAKTVILNVVLDNTDAITDFYLLEIEQIRYRTGSTTGSEVTITTGFEDYQTGYESINK